MDNNSSGWIILIAILGAAAWIPHLVQLFLKIITKPRLITVNQKEIEIGFNTLGPIINIGLAFLSEKDKALIQKISLQLKHSSHASHLFLWSWYEESLFQMDFPKVSIPYKKNQTAIALNVAKDFMVEKKIGFQSKEFKEKLDEIGELVNEDYANFKNTNRDLETIKSTKNYNDLVNHFDNSFIWSTRKYTVNIDIYVLKKKTHLNTNWNLS